jgi:hypothetical protein
MASRAKGQAKDSCLNDLRSRTASRDLLGPSSSNSSPITTTMDRQCRLETPGMVLEGRTGLRMSFKLFFSAMFRSHRTTGRGLNGLSACNWARSL